MATITTTYTTPGSYSYTVPSNLLNGSVQVSVNGGVGASGQGGHGAGAGGAGGTVTGYIPTSSGTAFSGVVGANASGQTGGSGTHNGANGGNGGGSSGGYTGYAGGGGGGSSTVFLTSTSTLVAEAGGGGGGGGGMYASGGTTNTETGGAGGSSNNSGGNGQSDYAGNGGGGGSIPTGGGAGSGAGEGDGNGSPGANSISGSGGAGGAGNATQVAGGGGGGGGGYPSYGGGGGGGGAAFYSAGGGGAGGSNYAASTVSSPNINDAGSTAYGCVQFVAVVADAPLAPTLDAPANSLYFDAHAAAFQFEWTYNPNTNSGTQTAYALRLKQSGGSYGYWNGTNFSSSTPVWNTSTSQSVTIPASVVTDGYTYNWSVATQESYASLQGPFATDDTFTAQQQATVTYNSPTGTVNNAEPTISWTNTIPGGSSMTDYRVVIYNQAQYSAAGFVGGASPGYIDTGVVPSSSANSYAITSPLPQTSYQAWIQITETGGSVSNWVYGSFTVTYDSPATPLLTAVAGTDPVTGAPRVTVTLIGQDNLLSLNDASFETGLGTWTAGSHTTIAQSTAHGVVDGAYSMSVVSSGGSGSAATSATYPVIGGLPYTMMSEVYATSVFNVTVGISWYTSGNSLISSTTATIATVASTETAMTVEGNAPSNAAYAQITLALPTSETMYVDCVGLYQNASTPTWTRGGLVGTTYANILTSDDGGTTWTELYGANDVSLPSSTQEIVVYDYETTPTVERIYQATVYANVTYPTTATVLSSPVEANVTVTTIDWWLVSPLVTSLSIPLKVSGEQGHQIQQYERSASQYALGQKLPNIVADVVSGQDGLLTVYTTTPAAWTALETALASQQIFWLTSPFGTGWYVRIGLAPGGTGAGGAGGNPVNSATLIPSTTTNPWRTVQIQYIQVASPTAA